MYGSHSQSSYGSRRDGPDDFDSATHMAAAEHAQHTKQQIRQLSDKLARLASQLEQHPTDDQPTLLRLIGLSKRARLQRRYDKILQQLSQLRQQNPDS